MSAPYSQELNVNMAELAGNQALPTRKHGQVLNAVGPNVVLNVSGGNLQNGRSYIIRVGGQPVVDGGPAGAINPNSVTIKCTAPAKFIGYDNWGSPTTLSISPEDGAQVGDYVTIFADTNLLWLVDSSGPWKLL